MSTTFPASGQQAFSLGGSIDVATGKQAGTYSATITITATYQ